MTLWDCPSSLCFIAYIYLEQMDQTSFCNIYTPYNEMWLAHASRLNKDERKTEINNLSDSTSIF